MANNNNKRIAQNTLMLYMRTIVTMGISLYTSRLILASLGVDDFGIYNVVGGIVAVLAFLNTSMAGSTQRFLNMELGVRSQERIDIVFSTAQRIHLIIAVVILLLAETVGVWFLNACMNISSDRIYAANWVFQFSILSFFITIISVPYNAAIIAHEKMSIYAYISIVEVLLKLLVAYLISIVSCDRLIMYAALMALSSGIVRFIYGHYCSKNFHECRRYSISCDKKLLKQMLSFSGWTIFGALGAVSHTQGIAIVMNMFFGVAVNAAQGVATQITNVVNQFVTNFMTALNPQIVKTYAAGQFKEMQLLLYRGSRLGICLVSFFALPLIIETPFILNIWLTEVPDYTVIFVRIILLTSICNAFAGPLSAAKGATGNIKLYQVVLTTLGWIHLPLAWICFEYGAEPYAAMYIYMILVIIMQSIRIFMVCKSLNFPILQFTKNVLIRSFFMISISIISSNPKICLKIGCPTNFISLFLPIWFICWWYNKFTISGEFSNSNWGLPFELLLVSQILVGQ